MPDYELLVAEETLILDATEEICRLLVRKRMSRAELADRIGVTRPRITHILGGEGNVTLRTLAEIAYALDSDVKLKMVPRA